MAILDCSKLNTGYALEACTPPATPGTGSRVILLSYSDIDRSKSTVTEGVISTIVLKTGAQGYEVDSLPDATVGEVTFTAGTYMNSYGHQITVRIFEKSEAAKKFGNNLLNALVVAIVENKEHGEGGEVKYEVYGWSSGLKMSAVTAATTMGDNTAYLYTLTTPSAGRENTLPVSFFNTDESTTDAAVEALLSPATDPEE